MISAQKPHCKWEYKTRDLWTSACVSQKNSHQGEQTQKLFDFFHVSWIPIIGVRSPCKVVFSKKLYCIAIRFSNETIQQVMGDN